MKRRAHRGYAIIVELILVCSQAQAMWIEPQDMPVDRLVQNITAYLDGHPKDADAWYRLGRVHSYAYSMGAESLPVMGGESGKEAIYDQHGAFHPNKQPAKLSKEERIVHLREANKCLSKAIELGPVKPEMYLSLASLLEAGVDDAKDAKTLPGVSDPSLLTSDDQVKSVGMMSSTGKGRYFEPTTFDRIASSLGLSQEKHNAGSIGRERDRTASTLFFAQDSEDERIRERAKELIAQDWQEQVAENYFRAFCAALPDESKMASRYDDPSWSRRVFVEAGTCYQRVIKARGEKPFDSIRRAVVKAALDKYDDLPTKPSPITPIIFSLENKQFSSLVDTTSEVRFDLDGSGLAKRWGWPVATTGILIYSTDFLKPITSGTQMFGSVSWWLLFDDGYQALSMLDDNRDGLLKSDELKGIAAWFDRNSNGVSESGEVIAVADLGIDAIETRSTGVASDGRSLECVNGIHLKNGQKIPTFDWTTEPNIDAVPTVK